MKIHNSPASLCGRRAAVLALALAITTSTALADYHSTVLGDHPLAYYPINSSVDPTGTTATDLSGNGNNGTYNGTDPQFDSVPGPSAFIPNALVFDGFTSFVDLGTGGHPSLLNFGGPITMEAWAQPANTTEGPADILGKGYDSANNYYELALRANGGNYFGGTYGPAGTQGATGGQQTTNWTHVVCTFDATNWNLYVNGVLVQSNPDTAGAINFSDPWRIGTGSADGANRYFLGNLTEVALYTNALTRSQVLTHLFMGAIGVMPSNAVPLIVTQPQPQSAYAGGTVTFSVTSVSPLTTTNQWYKGSNPITGKTNSVLTLSNVQSSDATNYSVRVGNSNGFTNSIAASFTLLPAGNSLRWSLNANSTGGTWDTGVSSSWINVSNSLSSVFNTGDQVLFDDTAGVPTNVTVSGFVSPSLLTVNSSANNFTFSGSGNISGSGTLVKQGSSTLTILSGGSLTGPATISGGEVYAGNFSFSSVASIVITNNATLDIGGGALTGNKPVTVSGAGVGGRGAIINSYADYPGNQLNITLAGDTTFGGGARWDLIAGSQISGPHRLTLDWSADTNSPYGQWTSVAIGADVGGIILTNGSSLGLAGMDSACQNPGTVLTVGTNCQLQFYSGGFNGSLHVLSGATAFLWSAPGAFNGNTITLEQGASWQSYYGSSTEPVNSALTLNGVVRFVVGDHYMTYTNVINGPGGFVLDNFNHAMVLFASNTYSGPTVIGSVGAGPAVALAGDGSISHSSPVFFGGNDPGVVRMDVSGRSDQTWTLASGQTLAGVGAINGSLVVSAGATVSPGGTNTTLGITTGSNPIGTLAASDNVTLNGTTVIKLNGSGTNDVIQAAATIHYGGTLNLVNISAGPLAAGDSFPIFSAAVHSGVFAGISPSTPGAGLAWDTNQLGSGILGVVAQGTGPIISSARISGGNLIFSGSGGTINGSYYVLSSTNASTPLANWTPVATNHFDASGNFSVTNTVNSGKPQQYYLLHLP